MKCPICKTGELSLIYLYQSSHTYKLTKKGKVHKHYTVESPQPTDVSVLCCSNGCNVNDLDWDLDVNDYLIIENRPRLWRK